MKVRATLSIMVAASTSTASSRVGATMCTRSKKSQSPGKSWNFDCAALPASAIALRTPSRGLGADHVRDLA